MGAINDAFSQNTLSFSKIQEILNNLITQGTQGGGVSKNKQILQEIGLLSEYSYIISDKVNNEIVYYSKNYKIIENLIPLRKMYDIFLEWNKYLFDIRNEELENIQQFNMKIENFKKRTLNKEFFQNNIKKYLFKDKAFNKLLNYGIPNKLRFFIWDIVLSEKYNDKYYNYEQELKEYKILLSKKGSNPQIEKDINRTFMKENEQTPNNIQILKNILSCINTYNSSGYCQGMNFIIGYLLKLTNYDEVKTFYIFKSILYDIKGYFEDGFPLLKKNNNLFNTNFKELCPKLYKHFQKHDIVNEFWVSKWMQTLFTLSIPFEELTVIWDVLLIRGFDFIVYICLAIIEFIEKDLLELKESAEIISYLEKVLNCRENGLIPANKKFFEESNNYIIPLNEVLGRAYDLEKKNVGGNDNRPYYDRRKSDSNLTNFKFNKLKTLNISNINNSNINNSNNKNDERNTLSKKTNKSPCNKNINSSVNVLNFQKNNLQNPNYNFQNNINNNIQNRKIPFYSTKALETYNFGDFNNNKLIGNCQNNGKNVFNNNNSVNLNFAPPQFQYINNKNLVPNNMVNQNLMMQYH